MKLKTPIGIAGLVFSCYCLFLHHTDYTEAGLQMNLLNGEVTRDIPGWNITAPWVMVAKVNLQPMRICITSAGRGFNCKLVQFNIDHLEEFVVTEGFYYYWWANRLSFNLGSDEQYRGIRNLMRGYGYDLGGYSFVKILEQRVSN